MNEAYKTLAYHYDELQKDIDYSKFTNLIDEHIDAKSKILEIGCGTGIIANYLTKNNHNVDAFDLSKEMIEVSKTKYPDINFYVDDVTTFNTDEKYDVVICLMDTLNYIIKYRDLEVAFKNIYNSLKPNGLFIFDVHQEDNVQLFQDYEEEAIVNGVTFKWNSQVIDKLMIHNMEFNNIKEQHKQYIYTRNEIRNVYQSLFSEVALTYDDYKDYYVLKKE